MVSMMQTFDGVDMTDPAIVAALAQARGGGGEGEKKDGEGGEKKDEEKKEGE